MNSLLVALGLILLASPAVIGQCSNVCYADVYTFSDFFGTATHYNCYSSNLANDGLDDSLYSATVLGLWMFYENTEYNLNVGGYVFWMHGIDFGLNLDNQIAGKASSLKFSGNRFIINEDSYTLYSGELFTGNEFYGNIDAPDLAVLNGDASSVVLTGESPWTFYTGSSYTGFAYCFLPDTDTDINPTGPDADFGIYPSLTAVSVPDNSFFSARKGCLSKTVFRAPKMASKTHGFGRVDANGKIIPE